MSDDRVRTIDEQMLAKVEEAQSRNGPLKVTHGDLYAWAQEAKAMMDRRTWQERDLAWAKRNGELMAKNQSLQAEIEKLRAGLQQIADQDATPELAEVSAWAWGVLNERR